LKMIWLYNLIDVLFNLLSLAIVVRAIISWFNINPYHPLVVFLDRVTEPILAPIRRIIPPIGMMDISPLVALILLQVIRQVLLALIAGGL